MGKDQEFSVNTRGAGGQGKVDVKITSPSRRPIPCKVETGPTSDVYSVKYMPPEEGPYKVDVCYDGHPVPGSPFTVEGVMPPDPTKVRTLMQQWFSLHCTEGSGLDFLCACGTENVFCSHPTSPEIIDHIDTNFLFILIWN